MKSAAGLLAVVWFAACARSAATGGGQAAASAPSQGVLVARVGAAEIREDDLQRAMARDPGASPARFAVPGARRELVEGLVRFELLVQAADKAGYTKDPDAIHALQQIAVTKFLNAELGKAASPDGISRADIEREYAARRDKEFTLPEAARVRHVRVSDAKVAAQVAAAAKALNPRTIGPSRRWRCPSPRTFSPAVRAATSASSTRAPRCRAP